MSCQKGDTGAHRSIIFYLSMMTIILFHSVYIKSATNSYSSSLGVFTYCTPSLPVCNLLKPLGEKKGSPSLMQWDLPASTNMTELSSMN